MYEIAYNLRVPLSTVMAMDYTEYKGWIEYFNTRPIGWREDVRTYRIMQAFGVTEKIATIFDSIATLENAAKEAKGATGSLQGSVMFKMMQNAKGGDVVPFA